jgi:UDP-N-acetylglucosamine transferase subunit ALG13
MILVTVGNHDQEFTRLIKRIEEIAPKIKEKIVVQRGYTKYEPRGCVSFEWSPLLEDYIRKASLVVTHAGIGTTLEVIKKHKKPVIVVPRDPRIGEHINMHQMEYAEDLNKKRGVKVITNMNDLTSELLNGYRKVVGVDDKDFLNLQNYLKKIIQGEIK